MALNVLDERNVHFQSDDLVLLPGISTHKCVVTSTHKCVVFRRGRMKNENGGEGK